MQSWPGPCLGLHLENKLASGLGSPLNLRIQLVLCRVKSCPSPGPGLQVLVQGGLHSVQGFGGLPGVVLGPEALVWKQEQTLGRPVLCFSGLGPYLEPGPNAGPAHEWQV